MESTKVFAIIMKTAVKIRVHAIKKYYAEYTVLHLCLIKSQKIEWSILL
jgi:hypothetical protein